MNYKIGYKIKPKKTENGVVIFTDGVNEVPPSQKSCQAYGYKWDKKTSTCITGVSANSLSKKLNEKSNKIGGKNNKTGGYVESSVVYGNSNYLEGDNKNIIVNGNNNRIKGGVYNSAIISGNDNIISEDVNNSTVISGQGGVSIRDNETIVGGFQFNAPNSPLSHIPVNTQVSTFIMQESFISENVTKLLKLDDLDYIPTHPNSKIHINAKILYATNAQFKVSTKQIECMVSVTDANLCNVMNQVDYLTLTSTPFPDTPEVYFSTNSNGQLQLEGFGQENAFTVITANITLTETIFGQVTLN